LRDVPEHQDHPEHRAAVVPYGAALSAICRSDPSRDISTVWFANPTMYPESMTFCTGFSTVFRVLAFTISKTSLMGWPMAFSLGQPVSFQPWG